MPPAPRRPPSRRPGPPRAGPLWLRDRFSLPPAGEARFGAAVTPGAPPRATEEAAGADIPSNAPAPPAEGSPPGRSQHAEVSLTTPSHPARVRSDALP